MQGIEEDGSNVELRNGRVGIAGDEPKNAWSQNVSRGEDIIEDKADHNFPKMLLVDVPLLEGEVLIKEVIKVPISQLWLEDPDKATDLSGQEEVWGWRSTSWSSRMKRQKMSWPTAHGGRTFHHSGWDDQHLLPYVSRSFQGFLRDLARSLGEDASMTDVLQTSDDHYGMMMTFDTLSKELYSLKQTSGQNVAEFRVYLSQQVQIFQLEYPERIQQEHVEEMKWDCFYEGLSPKFRYMLAHQVDGDHPTSCSDLLLAAQKLEIPNEAGDHLLPKATTTGGLNITHSQTLVNLFPSQKLKGNQTFTVQSVTMEGNEAGEDLDAKPEWEEEVKYSAEDPEASSGLCGADQLISYIVHFANVGDLYQKKTRNCFGCGSPDNLVRDCPKDVGKIALKASLNAKEGTMKKGGQAHQNPPATQPVFLDVAP